MKMQLIAESCDPPTHPPLAEQRDSGDLVGPEDPEMTKASDASDESGSGMQVAGQE